MKKVISGFIAVCFTIGLAQPGALAAERTKQTSSDYYPSAQTAEEIPKSSSKKFGFTQETQSTDEFQTLGRKAFPNAIGRSDAIQDGLRYYGTSSTDATSLVVSITVHGYLGKDPKGKANIKWYDDDYNDNWWTRGSTSVYLGENVKLGARVGDSIVVDAKHTVSVASGTYSARTGDTLKP